MGQSHSHRSPPSAEDKNARRLLLAFCVTAGFMLIEVAGGLISGSLALLADAGHMLTDAAALLFAFLAVRFASRPPNAQHTFGWLRLTTLAAFLNAIALVVITILIVWEAIQRFHHPQPVAGKTMMIIAVAGLLANILAFWILHRGSGSVTSTCAPPRCTCWGFARFGWRHYCRDSDPHHRLDAYRSYSVRAGVVPGSAQRLASAAGERQ